MSEWNPFPAPEVPITDSFKEAEITSIREKPRRLPEEVLTIFSVQKYFEDTDREDYVDNVGQLNTPKIEEALMKDISKAETPEERMRIRELLHVALTGGFIETNQEKKEIAKKEIMKMIVGRIRRMHWEYMRLVESGDEVRHEEFLMTNWRRIAVLISSKNEIMDDEELLFIEETLQEMKENLDHHPRSRQAQDVYEKIRKVRTAMYLKAFHPDTL
jgi:hypothetical protein